MKKSTKNLLIIILYVCFVVASVVTMPLWLAWPHKFWYSREPSSIDLQVSALYYQSQEFVADYWRNNKHCPTVGEWQQIIKSSLITDVSIEPSKSTGCIISMRFKQDLPNTSFRGKYLKQYLTFTKLAVGSLEDFSKDCYSNASGYISPSSCRNFREIR